jgi:hypothetical protein
MKAVILTLAVFAAVATYGQRREGYWVVETEGKTAKQSVVRIYDAGNNLVNERTVNRLIDINKKTERRRLNRLLKQQESQLLWSKR